MVRGRELGREREAWQRRRLLGTCPRLLLQTTQTTQTHTHRYNGQVAAQDRPVLPQTYLLSGPGRGLYFDLSFEPSKPSNGGTETRRRHRQSPT
jgi:hypothetical protein